MKFSVLLPTRNRLPYLKQAVETVRQQDYDEWELIIADNCSDEDVGGYVRSLQDPRIRHLRSETFLPVTDNWNRALENSTGEYIIMLGDDDGLLRGYFRNALRLIDSFGQPDVVYTGAYLYSYPGAMPGSTSGYIRPYGYASFLQNATEPFILDKSRAVAIGKEVLRFRVVYGFNVQFYLIRRAFVDSLRNVGPFYQSAFPDYYATNVAFLKADRILVCPSPMVVIGVCPKSYGAYYNSNRESQGVMFLEGSRGSATNGKLDAVKLPGSNINTSWLYAAEKIRENYGREFGLEVDYDRYRRLQTLLVLRECYTGERSRLDLIRLSLRLKAREWPLFAYLQVLPPMRRMRTVNRMANELGQFIAYDHGWMKEGVDGMADVFARASTERYEYQ